MIRIQYTVVRTVSKVKGKNSNLVSKESPTFSSSPLLQSKSILATLAMTQPSIFQLFEIIIIIILN